MGNFMHWYDIFCCCSSLCAPSADKLQPGDIIFQATDSGTHTVIYHGDGMIGHSQIGTNQSGVRTKSIADLDIRHAAIYRNKSPVIAGNIVLISKAFSEFEGSSRQYTTQSRGNLPTPFTRSRSQWDNINDRLMCKNLIFGMKILLRANGDMEEDNGFKHRSLSRNKGVSCSDYACYMVIGGYMSYLLTKYSTKPVATLLLGHVTNTSVKANFTTIDGNILLQISDSFYSLCHNTEDPILVDMYKLYSTFIPKRGKAGFIELVSNEYSSIWTTKYFSSDSNLNESTALLSQLMLTENIDLEDEHYDDEYYIK